MSYKTKYKNKEQFKKELLNLSNQLIKYYNDIDIVLTEKLYSIEKENYQFISRLLKTDFNDRTKHMFYYLLFRDIFKTETISAGSAKISFLFAINLIKNIIQSDIDLSNENDIKNQLENYLFDLKNILESSSFLPKEKDLQDNIYNICQEKLLSNVCWEALKLAGLEGKIFLENSKNDSFVVETKNGYSFNLKPYGFFLTNNTWQASDVKVLVVDGFIENVSEIDQILNSAFASKQNGIIIAQGFSEEVISTLYVNFQKKNINILPLRLQVDIDNINVMNDISVVCGLEPISTFKGQLLTFVKWDELPTIDKITVLINKTIIENKKTKAAVSNQIRMILDKRMNSHIVEDIQDQLDGRMRSLISNSVHITLPNTSSIKSDEQKVKLDNSIRQTKTMLNYGLISSKEVKNKLINNTTLFEKLLNKSIIETIKNEKYPLLSVYFSIYTISKTVLMLLSSGGRIELDII